MRSQVKLGFALKRVEQGRVDDPIWLTATYIRCSLSWKPMSSLFGSTWTRVMSNIFTFPLLPTHACNFHELFNTNTHTHTQT